MRFFLPSKSESFLYLSGYLNTVVRSLAPGELQDMYRMMVHLANVAASAELPSNVDQVLDLVIQLALKASLRPSKTNWSLCAYLALLRNSICH